jgi:hypothetical protein
MTYIPVPQRTNNQKVSGIFYPLQKEELMALRKSRLINNAAYVHLALRFENPFCDRPIELAPKEFARRWTIPESSVYEALGRLKKLEIVNIKTGKIVISWADSQQLETIDCQQDSDSDNREFLRDSRNNSGNSESILGSQNELQDLRINSDISENRRLEPSPDNDSGSSQTVQTLQKVQTLQTEKAACENEIENKQRQVEEQVTAEERPSCHTKSTLTPLSNVLADPKDPVKEQPPRTENDSHKRANSVNDCSLPQDLKNKLEELEIPLDAKVRKAISRHHILRAYGAAAHVERTRATIDNPRGVFLFQLPKQPIEQLGTRGKVITARDMGGYTLAHLQKMYPDSWQSAAVAFGLEFSKKIRKTNQTDKFFFVTFVNTCSMIITSSFIP